ncbi:MAG: RNA methyltransferase [Clostridia bacterium]|nr:RNA methyltransferase [Clostridia bacterium]
METLGASNKRVKLLKSLSHKSARYKEGLVFLEGGRLVRDSARYGAEVKSVFYNEGYDGELFEADESFVLPEKVFDSLTDTVTPQGVCAVAKMPKKSDNVAEGIKSNLIVLCDNVRDPGNMGTVIRTAHAFGAGALLITEGCTDPFGLKCVRASMGSVFAIDIVQTDLKKLQLLKEKGWSLAAGILGDDCVPLPKADFSGKTILAVGSEADGISDNTAALCDLKVKIPMYNGAESFNAAVAAGIMMYEYRRQNS